MVNQAGGGRIPPMTEREELMAQKITQLSERNAKLVEAARALLESSGTNNTYSGNVLVDPKRAEALREALNNE